MAAVFQYRARDALGKEHEGTVEAQSQEEAVGQLRRDGLAVLEIDEDAGVSILRRAFAVRTSST
ncbi:MAG: hypothetical protein QM775_05165 [Pirellulales bacterium]